MMYVTFVILHKFEQVLLILDPCAESHQKKTESDSDPITPGVWVESQAFVS